MNTANSDLQINYLHEGETDYVSYNSIYNEVLDKVKKGLEKQRSNSSILKKAQKNNSKSSENLHPEDIALFQDDDSDDSDSDDFLEWENSDNDSVYNSRFGGGLTRAKSHLNDINDYNNNNNNNISENLDIVKDRIVLNKHFQKIYGFNDTSFRHGSYETFNNNDDDDNSDEDFFRDEVKDISEGFNNQEKEETSMIENKTEEPKETELSGEVVQEVTENSNNQSNDNTNENDDLEKQFYNELRKASMIIDLQQHYRLRDGLKNKEDLKKEIVEGYNALNEKNYSYEDLPDFQNIENILEVEAKIINNESKDIHETSSNSLLNNNRNESIKNFTEIDSNLPKDEILDKNNNDSSNQLINDTWKFLFNNPYSLKFLSKSLKSSNDKLTEKESSLMNNDLTDTPVTEGIITESNTKSSEDDINTEIEATTSENSNFELNNSLMSNILKQSIENEEKLIKNREKEEKLRRNKENDWLSFVQKELSNMNLSTASLQKKQNTESTNYNIKEDYSKFIPNKIPSAPKFEFTIEQESK